MAKKKAQTTKPVTLVKPEFKVHTGDCLKMIPKHVKPGSVDLAFGDPPYNIGYGAYDNYQDNKPEDVYLYWMNDWMRQIYHALSDHGSFWLAISDEFVAQARLIAEQHSMVRSGFAENLGGMKPWPGFHLRSWCVWYYTFGVYCTTKFSRTHTHLLWFTKDKKNFTFNADAIRVVASRQSVYKDKRVGEKESNPDGKVPDNTWVLTKEALEECFGTNHDTWLASRVCGTFKERADRGKHQEKRGCPQMPEPIMERIVAACSNPGDLVIDPFLGMGTTGVAAVRNGRNFWGCDVSRNYVDRSRQRINRELV